MKVQWYSCAKVETRSIDSHSLGPPIYRKWHCSQKLHVCMIWQLIMKLRFDSHDEIFAPGTCNCGCCSTASSFDCWKTSHLASCMACCMCSGVLFYSADHSRMWTQRVLWHEWVLELQPKSGSPLQPSPSWPKPHKQCVGMHCLWGRVWKSILWNTKFGADSGAPTPENAEENVHLHDFNLWDNHFDPNLFANRVM